MEGTQGWTLLHFPSPGLALHGLHDQGRLVKKVDDENSEEARAFSSPADCQDAAAHCELLLNSPSVGFGIWGLGPTGDLRLQGEQER